MENKKKKEKKKRKEETGCKKGRKRRKTARGEEGKMKIRLLRSAFNEIRISKRSG